ncbi:MAG: MurR/RpiR family transcriptional regulator [Chloroflexi bacterium]|nr:MAG: MurR/RpiR family transcriptional regulator [Chloroflexota bacterium]
MEYRMRMSQQRGRVVNDGHTPPGLPDGMLSRIRVALASLNPAERKVADIVLAQPGQVVHQVIAEIAALADVSEGTVVRFCNSVGCRGYQALKLALAADLAQPTLVLQEDITPADASDPALVAQKVFASDMLALQDTLKLLDPPALTRAVKAIERGSELAFFGVGSSHAVLPSSAVAIGISHSGVSREPVECLALARARRATTIAVTARHPSPLTEHADIVLLTMSTETRYREEAMASRIAQLSLLDSLYVSVAIRRPDSSLDALRETSDALTAHRVR